MKQTQFTQNGPVLTADGRPIPGWGKSGLLQYDRKSIRAPFYRIKEWDWYQVTNQNIALQFTYGHASYAGQVGIMLFDFVKGEPIFTKDVLLALPFASMKLAASAEADNTLEYNKKDLHLRIETKNKEHFITCRCQGFEAELVLKRQIPDSLVINVPFNEKPKAFYYNQKISCMSADGYAVANGQRIEFGASSFGLLDWGRGVWPFHGEWYWSSASGKLGKEFFGFNLGMGFGNTDTATENCLFYKDGMHKLGKVHFSLPDGYAGTWRLHDDEGRLDVQLAPSYDRSTKIKVLWVDNCTHQMFGDFSGWAVLDDGTKLQIEGLSGFAEHAVNNW